MSIEAKHYYRFQYLKSDEWQTVRIEVLARERAHCQICGEESISNDAHHVWYPENIWETASKHLVVLCRPCHTFIHEIVPECKTNDEEVGRAHWLKFQYAIRDWRAEKRRLFEEENKLASVSGLRKAYVELKSKYENLLNGIIEEQDLLKRKERLLKKVPEVAPAERDFLKESDRIFNTLKAWEAAYKKSVDGG